MVRLMRSTAAWVATLVVMSLTTVEMPHMVGAHHDADFDIVVIAHDASAHRIADGQVPPARADHCLACHWGRSFRPGGDSGAFTIPLVETAVARVSEQPTILGRAPVAQPPLRSP